MPEGYDQFREMLTSHLDESSAKGKGGLLGMDRDERTGLLIGSAVGALMGGVSGQNPLVTGLAAYGQGADNIYNKRKQAIDMEQTQAKGELAKVHAFINLKNAQKSAASKPMTPNQYHNNYRQIINGQLGKWNNVTGEYEWKEEGNGEIARIAFEIQEKHQLNNPQLPHVAAANALREARMIYKKQQLAVEAKAKEKHIDTLESIPKALGLSGDSINPLKTGKFNLGETKSTSDWRKYLGG